MDSNTSIELSKKGRFKPLPLKRLSEKFIEKALHESSVDKNLEKANFNDSYKINIKSSLTGEDISYTPMINWGNFDINNIIQKLCIVSETITGITLYPYQKKVQQRIFESMLKNDGEEISILFARQIGKSELVTCTINTIMVMLPVLAKIFPKQLGMYSKGVIIGLFAPTNEQAFTIHSRMDARLSSDMADQILSDSAINSSKKYRDGILTINGPVIRTIGDKDVYEYVSICRLQSAAKQSKVESKTYHLIIMDEAQDIEVEKTQKSIRPMLSSVNGTLVALGTPMPQISDFYNMILRNKRTQHHKKVQNHFEVDYREGQKYNPKYKAFVKKELERLGEDSDSFRMSYKLEWLLEKGMALTPQQFEEYLKVVSLKFEYAPDGYSDYVAGVDLAKVMDSTVITIAKLKTIEGEEDPIKVVVNWVEMSGDNWEVQFHTILDIVRTYGIKVLTVDSTGGRDVLVERLQLALENEDCMVVPVVFNQKSKHEMATLFYEEMRKMRIRIPSNQVVRKSRRYKNFQDQFFSSEKVYKGPYLQIEHPDIKGAKDDYIDSLLLLIYGAKKNNFHPATSSKNIFFEKSGIKSERFKKAISQIKKRNRARWGRTMKI